MTEELLDRLAREALPQAREAAATQGIFSAHVDITVDRSAQPVTVTLTVTPGEPTLVTRVDDRRAGPGTDRRARRHRRHRARCSASGCCRSATVFRQSAWTAAKQRAVASLAASPYAAAKLAASEAQDRPRRAQRGNCRWRSSSGPAFHFGEIDVQGLDTYTPELVRNLRDDSAPATCTASARSTITSGACWRRAISRACRRRSIPIPRTPTTRRSRSR